MTDFEKRKLSFVNQMRDLLEQVENMRFSRENFGKKLLLVYNCHKLNYDNLDFIFFELGSEKFISTVTRKTDETLLEAQKCYMKLNTEKRLDPETKRIYRDICEFLLHLKTALAAKHLELEARKEVKSDLRLVIPLTPVVAENSVRRSRRLAKNNATVEEIVNLRRNEDDSEILGENVVLRRSSRLSVAHREA